MSLQPSSHPEARSLIAVFSLSSLLSLLDHFWHTLLIFRGPRPPTLCPCCVDVVQGVRIRAQGPCPGQTWITFVTMKTAGISGLFPQLFHTNQNKAEWPYLGMDQRILDWKNGFLVGQRVFSEIYSFSFGDFRSVCWVLTTSYTIIRKLTLCFNLC